MTQEEISTFTRRIVNSNKTELIVVLYDIFLARIEDGQKAMFAFEESHLAEDEKNMRSSFRKASEVLRQLMNDLDFRYEISGNLYSLYDYCMRCLAKLSYDRNVEHIEAVRKVMTELRLAFKGVADADDSAPVMQHAQQISAGYTYGKHSLNVTEDGFDGNRGFLA